MKKKHILILTASVHLLLGTMAVAAYKVYDTFFTPAFHIATQARIYIDRDDTPDSLTHKVQEVLSPRSIKAFNWLMRHEGYTQLKPGCYAFHTTDNLRTAVRRIGLGWQTPVRLIVPSVRTLDRMAQSLSKQLMVSEAEIMQHLTDTALVHTLGYTPATLPSLFIPNTYEVYWNIPVPDLIQRLQREHTTYWIPQRLQQANALGLTPLQVSTLASIVDEETAGDPTLRRILHKHLTIDSPYNTYIYKGLPPGPIRIPSMAALEAVLNPARHNYLYMCAKEDFSGTHNFASTLSQHNANARRYQQALNKRGIK